MSPTRTILFDAAGTLIEPAEPVAVVYARHFKEAGFAVGESRIGQAFGRVFRELPPPDYWAEGDGDEAERSWWRMVVRTTAIHCGLPAEVAGSAALFDPLFGHYASGSAWRVFSDVEPVLERLREERFGLAVVSNFDNRLHRILVDLGLADWFCPIVTSADACSRKPDSGIFQHALDLLDLWPSEALHIGDSAEADGEGARNVGIRAFLLDRPGITLDDALQWILGVTAGK